MTDADRKHPELIPEQAKRLGRIAAWAPGSYFNKCWTCETEFEGDKRAHQCLPCAVATKVEHAITEVVAAERAAKDAAYEERNRVVAALARLFPAGLKRTNIPGWDEEWHGCVYIDTPAGQLSWHFHDSQAHLFSGLPSYGGEWDGHDTSEKYRRLAATEARGQVEPGGETE